jgi:hypothetical protein
MEYAGDLPLEETELFLQRGLDKGANQLELPHKSGFARRAGGPVGWRS